MFFLIILSSIGYYYRDKKDHMSTTAIGNEEIGEIQSDSRGKKPMDTVIFYPESIVAEAEYFLIK